MLSDKIKKINKKSYLPKDTESSILENDMVFLTFSKKIFNTVSEQKKNIIMLDGAINTIDLINIIKDLTFNVNFCEQINCIYGPKYSDTDLVVTAKLLIQNNINLKIKRDSEDSEYQNFIDAYIDIAFSIDNDSFALKMAKSKVGELLVICDEFIIEDKIDFLKDRYNIKKTSFRKLLKIKSEEYYRERFDVYSSKYNFDINNIPDYVDKESFYKLGFFPVRNEKNKKIFYVFRSYDNKLIKTYNFFIEGLYHVYSEDKESNFRLVKITDIKGFDLLIKFNSDDLLDFTSFKKTIWRFGGFTFENGDPFKHEKILKHFITNIPTAYEIRYLGQQPDDFFSFTDGYYNYIDDKFVKYNDYGIGSFKGKYFFSPIYSLNFKVNTNKHKGKDFYKFTYENNFYYKPNKNIDFEKWATLVEKVYNINNTNGWWIICYSLLAPFRSEIFYMNYVFASLFFEGSTQAGKTSIVETIQALYGINSPKINLNSATDASIINSLLWTDVVRVLEEFGKETPDKIYFSIKAALDGESKQKMSGAYSDKVDRKIVESPFVACGQQAPYERDDGATANRFVILNVPKFNFYSKDQAYNFSNLKKEEKNGLSNVLLEILKYRKIVRDNFRNVFSKIYNDLIDDFLKDGVNYEPRIFNSVTYFLSILYIFTNYSKLKIPFSYGDFYKIAKKQIINQSSDISHGSPVMQFFEKLEYLASDSKYGIIYGKDYFLRKLGEIKYFSIGNNQTITKNLGGETNILFLRMKTIFPKYKKIMGNNYIEQSSLKKHFSNYDFFIGNVRVTNFEWFEKIFIEDMSGQPIELLTKMSSRTNALVFNYDILTNRDIIDLDLLKNYENAKIREKDQVLKNKEMISENENKPLQKIIDFTGGDKDDPPF
jgi:hypothetical protein